MRCFGFQSSLIFRLLHVFTEHQLPNLNSRKTKNFINDNNSNSPSVNSTTKQTQCSYSFTYQVYFILMSLKYAWPCMLINYCIIKTPGKCYEAYPLRDLERGHAKRLSKYRDAKQRWRKKTWIRNSNSPHSFLRLNVSCENMAINPGIPQTLFSIMYQYTRSPHGPLVTSPKYRLQSRGGQK